MIEAIGPRPAALEEAIDPVAGAADALKRAALASEILCLAPGVGAIRGVVPDALRVRIPPEAVDSVRCRSHTIRLRDLSADDAPVGPAAAVPCAMMEKAIVEHDLARFRLLRAEGKVG